MHEQPKNEAGIRTAVTHWREPDLALLEELNRRDTSLPDDAPRALLSIRLSTLTAESTSPVRQELDLRVLALERGYRVVGVASDLNVSATKVSPWRRRELGSWLNERAPDFDVLLFWKLDRFVRRLSDLSVMIDWCLRHQKNLVSRHEAIDLSTPTGIATAEILAGVAEIEAAGTGTRVASLWNYTRTQADWLVGKPPYGYTADGGGKLVVDEGARRVLRWCHGAALRGVSARRMATVLTRARIPTGGGGRWTASTLLHRLRNPALLGLRVTEDKTGGARRSKIVRGRDGKVVRVADGVFTESEWQALQTALDSRAKAQPARAPGGATRFLGVLVCADCATHMTVHRTRGKQRTYEYLRCRNCPSGGLGAPDPEVIYRRLFDQVMSALGEEPVRVREYVAGADGRERRRALEDGIAGYMAELEPSGRFTSNAFAREQAQKHLDRLIAQLNALGPESAEDRWVQVGNGDTFRKRWERGGREEMARDLRRAGLVCRVHRAKIPKARAPEVLLELAVPKDVAERLVVKGDSFPEP
ncbi:recombinase family protein [Kitasatospora sp. NPDC057015]|uniref:recombinase family protein n=1 Tax=Kitasatospora sp. NPDC057015 TaxID=3346001 RepID=UPI00363502DA